MNLVKEIKKNKKKKKITFEKIAKEWLETKKRNVKPSTYSNYLYSINTYLIKNLKNYSLKDLENLNYIEFINFLGKNLSSKTLKDIITKLKSILAYANSTYGSNINIKEIKVPYVNQEPVRILHKRELTRLINYCISQNNLKCIGIIIALNTGLRIGELCALKWKYIDLENKEIKIRHTVQRIYDETTDKTKVILIDPKSQTSIRNIPISDKLYSLLKPFKKNNNDENFFLTNKSDHPIEPRSYLNNFKKILKNSNIKKNYRFHSLRHTFATNCINAGMDVKSLSEILGHSSVDITLNKYVHSSYKMKKKYLEKI